MSSLYAPMDQNISSSLLPRNADSPDKDDGDGEYRGDYEKSKDAKRGDQSRKENRDREAYDDDEENERVRRRRKRDGNDGRARKKSSRHRSRGDDESGSVSGMHDDSNEEESLSEEGRRRRKRRPKERKHRKEKKSKKRKRRDDSSSSDEESTSSSSDDSDRDRGKKSGQGASSNNPKLLAKLLARGETLEERKQRRAARAEQKRAAFITTKFGYTAEDNPFHDPNLHQVFTWKKKQEKDQKEKKIQTLASGVPAKMEETKMATLEEIEKLRQRRKQRELQLEEMERIRREEARMKELENFDDWAKKEEEFHLQQQRQRSAIRLVQGREKPIDVLAKNMLLFGGVERENRAAVKYQERYNAFTELSEGNLDAELEEPFKLLHMLKLNELEEVLVDIHAFLALEREAAAGQENDEEKHSILAYWQALQLVAQDEIKYLKSGGNKGAHAVMVQEVSKIFEQGQSTTELEQMKGQILEKIRTCREQEPPEGVPFDSAEGGTSFDPGSAGYWQFVLEQLEVHLAKRTLSEIHSQMLVRQLERLEQRRQELSKMTPEERQRHIQAAGQHSRVEQQDTQEEEDDGGFGDVEEQELEEEKEEESAKLQSKYSWADKYRPRKPRYFNRVKTGYDWNKYNKAHYDRDNPPPKTVQGYKFNIFYPDLIDPSKTPTFHLLKADSDDFCIIRFTAGPPYEDVAFKIVNREWNKSRKHGFKSTFERGVLSLYFNFKSTWYRR